MSVIASVEDHTLDTGDHNDVYLQCQDLSANWEDIAINLRIKRNIIDTIKEDDSKAKKRLLASIASWLKRESPDQPLPTWRVLCNAITNINRGAAEKIAENHQCDCDKCIVLPKSSKKNEVKNSVNNESTNGKYEENGKPDKPTNFKALGAILVVSVLVVLIAVFCGWKFHYQDDVPIQDSTTKSSILPSSTTKTKTTENVEKTVEKDRSLIPEDENLLVHLQIISEVLPFCTHLRLPAHDCDTIRAQNPGDLGLQKVALLRNWRAVKERTWKEFIIPFALLSKCVKAKELTKEHSVYFDSRLKEDQTVLKTCKDINDHDS